MKKNLVSIGNSLGIVIDKPFVDLLGLNKRTKVIMASDGKHLIIKPIANDVITTKRKAKAPSRKISGSVKRKAAKPQKKKVNPKAKITPRKTGKKAL